MDDAGNRTHRWFLPARWRLDGLCLILLVGLTLAAFRRVQECGFINYDDPDFVTANAQVRSGLTRAGIRWAWGGLHSGFWHPLTWLSLQLDAELYGLNPAGFHRTSLLWHLCSVVLLYVFLRRLAARPFLAGFAAALWAVHPLHVESVAWVSERKDVVSTSFGLLMLLAYLSPVERPWRRQALVLACFVLGLLAKAMLVTLPCVLLLLDYWPLRRWNFTPGQRWRSLYPLVREKLLLFLAAGVFCVLTVQCEQDCGALASLARLPLPVRLGTALTAYVHYLWSTVWPSGLAILYPYPLAGLPLWQPIGAAVVLLVVSGLVLWQARRRPYLLVGWLWYVGTLFPVCGLIQVGPHAWADRYTYVPHIGLLIILVGALGELAVHGRAVRTLLGVSGGGLVLACAVATWHQLGYWRDSDTLWARDLAVTTDNWLAHYNYAEACVRQGRIDEAAIHWTESLRLDPNCAETHANLGAIRLDQGRHHEARHHLLRSVQLDGGREKVFFHLGLSFWLEGNREAALLWFRRALECHPDSAPALEMCGLILLGQGRAPEAEQDFRQALGSEDAAHLHSNLGAALFNQGKVSQAIEQFEEALRIDPEYAPARAKLTMAQRRAGRV